MLTIAGVVLSVALQAATPSLADAYYYFLQGRTLEGRGDLLGAIAAYKHAAELEPKASSVHAELAGLYARAGRAADAISEAETAITLDKTDREAHRILGLVQAAVAENTPEGARQTQMMSDAIGHLEQALMGARDPGAELALGRLTVRTNRLPKAIETLRNFLLDNPGYPEGVMLLAEAYERSGQVNDAIEVLAPLGDGANAQPDALNALAGLYERADRWKDAAAAWGALAAKVPDPTYRIQQATALLNGGDAQAARELLMPITKERPRDPSIWYVLAQAERRAGNPDGAEAAAKQISALDPADPRGPLALAEAREARRDFAGVVEALLPLYESRRTKVQPNDEVFAFAGMTLASAYESLDQFDRAEGVLREVITRDARDGAALNALGYLLANRGLKLDEAVVLIKRALVTEPTNPSYLDSLGWAYVKQGKFAEAIAPLEQATRAVAGSSILQDHLGDAYFGAKRYREAADAFTRALGGDRDGVDVAAITKKRDRARDLAK
ncbi:MAG: tetratricopeptide repeat protein [Acidobacteria bacterium]|nr:tetratricopeptide repeat protein [Acidobacteriota bacterium]MBP8273507.1 tetratricopeptide repeat protein [Acidobacteriota bacterium]